MKAIIFQNDFLSFPADIVKDHYVLDLTAKQDATEKRQQSKLLGEPSRVQLNLHFLPRTPC